MTTYVGLCSTCRYARVIENRRGSRFWLCSRSQIDERFPRYPPLPVLRCAGYERGRPDAADSAPPGAADGPDG